MKIGLEIAPLVLLATLVALALWLPVICTRDASRYVVRLTGIDSRRPFAMDIDATLLPNQKWTSVNSATMTAVGRLLTCTLSYRVFE